MSVGELKPKTLAVMRQVLREEMSSSDAMAFLQLSRQYERLSDTAEELERLEILEQQVAELSRANAELAKANAELSKAKSSSEGQQLDGEKDHAAGENSSQMTRDAAEPEFSRTRPKPRK